MLSVYSTVLLALLSLASDGGHRVAAAKAGGMQVVGNSGVSGQMMFLQSNGQVAILDKVENNPIQKPNGKGPASAVFYNYNSNAVKADNLRTNAFCAGGAILGDGRTVVIGGNKAVKAGGLTAKQNASPYYDYNGGKAMRFLSPCSGNNCQWQDSTSGLQKERWYATVEPMKDGSVMILGGMRDGGFVPSSGSNEPSYEFYPSKGGVTSLDILRRTVPLSLFPISYLLSDNRVFIQANKQASMWNTASKKEDKLPNIPGVPRVYPASGGSAMLPMVPDNNYAQTILFCGGQTLGSAKNWGNEGGPQASLTEKPASTSCTQIDPLGSRQWQNVDDLPEGRSMGQFIHLPDGTLWFGNGVTTGAAGYTTDPKSPGKPVGTSFGDNPSYRPLIYNPSRPSGQRWSQVGSTNVGRLYHSSATLLPDSSILISGSNPSPDVTSSQKWNTEYRVERWYPSFYASFYDAARPSNTGLPDSLGYGGSGFSLAMGSVSDASNTKVVVIRTGFSTHAMNMGQRMLQLRTATNGNTVRVAAMPANPSLFAPGPALAFVVVNGVPSQGKFVMIGNGQIGNQPVGGETDLTQSTSMLTMLKKPNVGKFRGARLTSFDAAALTPSQIPSLTGADKSRADALAQALNGDPISGTVLPITPDAIIGGATNTTTQSQVENVAGALANGTITETLSG